MVNRLVSFLLGQHGPAEQLRRLALCKLTSMLTLEKIVLEEHMAAPTQSSKCEHLDYLDFEYLGLNIVYGLIFVFNLPA